MKKDYIVELRESEAEELMEDHWVGELVRCKDCKFGEACKNGRGEHGVMCYNSHSASHSWVHEPDWFCADGEQREFVKPPTDSATDWDGVECE